MSVVKDKGTIGTVNAWFKFILYMKNKADPNDFGRFTIRKQHKSEWFQRILRKKNNYNANDFGSFYVGKVMQISLISAHFI